MPRTMSLSVALSTFLCLITVSHAIPFQPADLDTHRIHGRWSHYSHGWNHFSQGGQQFSQSSHRQPQSSHSFVGTAHSSPQSARATSSKPISSTASASSAPVASSSAGPLDPNAMDCQVVVPANALTAEGLSTPWELLPPCSQAVTTQQAFAEAAVIDGNGQLSIYHPLIIDKGKTPQAAPIVPKLDGGSQIALFFGFNGGVLTLVDTNGQDTFSSPILKKLQCVNGLPGVQGDVFGQVSWCNTEPFWNAANAAVQNGELNVPSLGTSNSGTSCPSSRSFEIVDQDQSDNLPTQYLLLSDGSTVQFTAANKAKFPTATEIDNASDESLVADFIDPAIGCTPFEVDSIDDPGAQVASLATNELQAFFRQQQPIALVPLNDPDTLLTASGGQSSAKTNAYRLGVNQPLLGSGGDTNDGSPTAYCNNLVKVQPPFLASFQDKLQAVTTPDAGIGNNLFTFLCNRFLQSLTNLKCQNQNIPVKCTLNGAGAATACTIGVHNSTSASSSAVRSSTASSQSFARHSSHAHSQSFAGHSSHAHSHSSAVFSATASSQSFTMHSSHANSQSSAPHSSFAHSQSFATHSSQAHSQSFAAHSSQAHSQSFAQHSSQAHSQSFAQHSSQAPSQSSVAGSSAPHSSFANSQSFATQSSQAHSQSSVAGSSAPHSSFANSQSFATQSSQAHSQSSVAGSSAPHSSFAHSQGEVPSTSAPHSASYTDFSSPAVLSSSAVPQNFGNNSFPAGASTSNNLKVRQATATQQESSVTACHGRENPWFV